MAGGRTARRRSRRDARWVKPGAFAHMGYTSYIPTAFGDKAPNGAGPGLYDDTTTTIRPGMGIETAFPDADT